jgi:hypothetical protein
VCGSRRQGLKSCRPISLRSMFADVILQKFEKITGPRRFGQLGPITSAFTISTTTAIIRCAEVDALPIIAHV